MMSRIQAGIKYDFSRREVAISIVRMSKCISELPTHVMVKDSKQGILFWKEIPENGEVPIVATMNAADFVHCLESLNHQAQVSGLLEKPVDHSAEIVRLETHNRDLNRILDKCFEFGELIFRDEHATPEPHPENWWSDRVKELERQLAIANKRLRDRDALIEELENEIESLQDSELAKLCSAQQAEIRVLGKSNDKLKEDILDLRRLSTRGPILKLEEMLLSKESLTPKNNKMDYHTVILEYDGESGLFSVDYGKQFASLIEALGEER